MLSPRRPASLRPGQMVSSLHQRNYRLFFFGQLVSVAGTWMQTVAQAFLVLERTHRGLRVPAAGLCAAGLAKRRGLSRTRPLPGLLAGVFATTVGTHLIKLGLVY